MSNLQKEAAVVSNRARIFNAISACFDSLPSRFKAGELERLAGFKPSPLHRSLVASVLVSDFKCRRVGLRVLIWVKP